MTHVFQLEKHTNYPGGSSKKTLKTFLEEDEAKAWLNGNGYEEIDDRWENNTDHDPLDMFDVWQYVKIERYPIG